MKGMIIVRPRRCLGCKACELACAVEHSKSKDLYQAILEDPPPAARVEVTVGQRFATPLQCRQCADAQCVKICPKEALTRADADSPIVVDHDKCTKCRFCIVACPFGLISLDEKSKSIIKCDQCVERLHQNELPACVTACPTGALRFEPLDEIPADERDGFLVRIGRE